MPFLGKGNPVIKTIEPRVSTPAAAHRPWFVQGSPMLFDFLHAKDCVFIGGSISPHQCARLCWTLSAGNDGLLGSEIYPDYKKTLTAPGIIIALGSG